MNERRSNLRVMYDILKVLQNKGGSMKPTHIMYKSNLSHKMMERYLNDLVLRGMITEKTTTEGKIYILEQRGCLFLEKYKTVTEFLDFFGIATE